MAATDPAIVAPTQIIFVDPLHRIVEAVSEVIVSLGAMVSGTEVASSVEDAVARLRAGRRAGHSVALVAPRNAMPTAPARDALRREANNELLESVDVLDAILKSFGRLDETLVPVIVPHLFVDDPAELAQDCMIRNLSGVLIAKTADITNVGSKFAQASVLATLRSHLAHPERGVRRLDRIAIPIELADGAR